MISSTVTGYAALRKGQSLNPFTYEIPDLGGQEVRIAISHCGLCFTDIQAIDDFYHITKFPFVPGHEIVGYVSEVGEAISDLKVGDRVGIGWQGRACMHCEWCLQGEVNLCQHIVRDAVWTPYGGFSSSITADARFTYRLPEGMPSEVAAVLMCAGITVYSPLKMHASAASRKLGIIGVGGLGHLAIQYAKAFGYEVTAISSSPGKKAEALAFGADHFIVVGDENAMQKVEYYFDLLLGTAHGEVDWESLLETLKKKGRLILVGFPEMTLRPIDLVAHELSISGSFLGTPEGMREMLSFSQMHGIQPMVELMPMAQINTAVQRLKENKARYRIVLFNDLKAG
jgi:uncharacterized zinc-type alcohol dehydrogenase-like protein